jgi:hypothetical protein
MRKLKALNCTAEPHATFTTTTWCRWQRAEWRAAVGMGGRAGSASALKALLRNAGLYIRKKDIAQFAEV